MDVVPLVLMTGFGWDPGHSIVKARQAGLQAVLYKPFRLDQLLGAIEQIIHCPRPVGAGIERCTVEADSCRRCYTRFARDRRRESPPTEHAIPGPASYAPRPRLSLDRPGQPPARLDVEGADEGEEPPRGVVVDLDLALEPFARRNSQPSLCRPRRPISKASICALPSFLMAA